MHRSVLVARIKPGMQEKVAAAFTEVDSGELPDRVGLRRRTLFRFHDLMINVVETDQPVEPPVVDHNLEKPGFLTFRDRLTPYIESYHDESLQTPHDSIGREFYQFTPEFVGSSEFSVEERRESSDRVLIVGRIKSSDEADVARIFADSDKSELPELIGVKNRSLFRFQDIYMHYLEGDKPLASTVAAHREHEEFIRISELLQQFILPYDPRTWSGPADAMATEFYHWVRPNM